NVLVIRSEVPVRFQTDVLMRPPDPQPPVEIRLVEDSFQQLGKVFDLNAFEMLELLRVAQQGNRVRIHQQMLIEALREFARMLSEDKAKGLNVPRVLIGQGQELQAATA